MNNFYKQLMEDIEKSDTVTLFRHIVPDPDAWGSQLGLKAFLKAKFPKKTILALGNGENMDTADDKAVEESVAIITDTSNSPRIDDQRYKDAKKIYRIDHHVKVEDLGTELIDDKAAAACELITLMLEQAGEEIPAEAAQYLMEGLMADTQRFTIGTVRPETYRAAAWLKEQGADPREASVKLFSKAQDVYTYSGRIISKACKKNNFLFAVMDGADYLSCGLTFERAKDNVDSLSGVEGIVVWALFTQMKDGIHYSASLRSGKIPIRDIAAKFNGGGHECASGCRDLSIEDVSMMIGMLAQRSLQTNE